MAWPTGSLWLFAGAGFVAAATAGVLVWESGGQLPISSSRIVAPRAQSEAAAPPMNSSPKIPSTPTPSVSSATTTSAAAPSASQPTPAIGGANPEGLEFDVVRVEPGGDAVVAGHGPPKARIALRIDGKIVDSALADDVGQVVFVPSPLSPGPHVLELASSQDGGAPSISKASTIVVDPKVALAAHPAPTSDSAPPRPTSAIAISEPGPTPIDLSAPKQAPSPSPSARVPTGTVAPPTSPVNKASPLAAPTGSEVFVVSVEATAFGRLKVKGSTEPGRTVRLYLNGTYLADAMASPEGLWSLTIEHGMTPGDYSVRADVVDASNGAVVARAEVPFLYPRAFPTPKSMATVTPVAQRSPTLAAAPDPEADLASATGETGTPAPYSSPTTAGLPAPAPKTNENKSTPGSPTPFGTGDVAADTLLAPNSKPALETTPTPTSNEANQGSNVVVEDLRTTTVSPGDTLWRFGERYYGNGALYGQIYAANTKQIRNPHWIYPGQIFVVPESK